MEHNEFETYIPIKIDSLDKINLVDGTNYVLIKENIDDVKKSVGGIITEGLETWNFAKNTPRRGEVIKVVGKLVLGKHGSEATMKDNDLEIKPGDKIYYRYFDALNSFLYECDGEVYKLIRYSEVILVIRGDNVIMCNGYLLVENIPSKKMVNGLMVYEHDTSRRGIVKKIGKPNRKYLMAILSNQLEKYLAKLPDKTIYDHYGKEFFVRDPDRRDDGIEVIEEGDEILISDPRFRFDLEDYAYARFDDKRTVYSVVQAHTVIAIIR